MVTAPENASNVVVFCEVTFGDGGTFRTSVWYLTLKNESRERGSEPNFDTVQSNFTIHAELDMAILECTNILVAPQTNIN